MRDARASREENEGIYRDVLFQLSEAVVAADPSMRPLAHLVVREVYVIKGEQQRLTHTPARNHMHM